MTDPAMPGAPDADGPVANAAAGPARPRIVAIGPPPIIILPIVGARITLATEPDAPLPPASRARLCWRRAGHATPVREAVVACDRTSGDAQPGFVIHAPAPGLPPGPYSLAIRLEAADGAEMGTVVMPAEVHDRPSVHRAPGFGLEQVPRFALADLPRSFPDTADLSGDSRIEFRSPVTLPPLQLEGSDLAQVASSGGVAKRLFRTFDLPAVSISVVTDAAIIGPAMVVASPRGVVDDSWGGTSPKGAPGVALAALRDGTAFAAEFDTVMCPAFGERDQRPRNHYHFHADHLCALLQMEDLLTRHPGLQAETLLPVYSPVQQEAVRLLAPRLGPTRPLGEAPIRARRLLIPSLGRYYSGNPDPMIARVLTRMRRHAMAAAPEAAAAASRFVYIGRLDASLRPMGNEPELAAALERRGAAIFDARGLGYRDQVLAFAQAKVIVGPHGAGLTNMGFAPPGALVVEILPAFHVFQYFSRLADFVGHRYRCFGQATPGANAADGFRWNLDIPAFLGFLDPLLEREMA